MAREANVDGDGVDDRAPLLSFPPRNDSVRNVINAEGNARQTETEVFTEVGGSRF